MTAAQPSKSRPLEPGIRVAGKLELLRRIAEGGMGDVWVARNVKTDAEVAVKVLRPHRGHDDHAAERFRHEAKLGATLAHRNITRVFDLLEDEDGSLILVMELLRGETLRGHYKAAGSLSTREAVAIIVPILSALQHAHDHGVVHRDLKPTNIFLHADPDGQMTPKLLDFGIAKARDSTVETQTGDALGTPSYMSPEQVRAKKLDGRSDLFSVAVALYEVITGQNPFQGDTSTAALAHVLELEVDPDPKIEPRVWLEINRALSKQAYERHASARELATALCAAVGESEAALVRSLRREPRAPRPEPAAVAAPDRERAASVVEEETERQAARLPRSRRVVLAGGAALLLAAGGAFLLRSSTEQKQQPSGSAPEAVASESAAPPSAGFSETSDRAAVEPLDHAKGPPPAGAPKAATQPKRPARHSVTPEPPAPSRPPASAPSKSLARKPGF